MVKYYVLCTLYLLLFLLFPQIPEAQTNKYKFRHLTIEDGLPSSRIEYVMKDSHGFIWIGSKLGLCRYNGYNFKVFQYDPDDSTSLTHSNTHSNILEDKDGFIWMGNNFGLNKFDPVTETFKRYTNNPDDTSSLSNNFVRVICQDRAGSIWIGTTNGGGLIRYNHEDDNFTIFRNGTNHMENCIISLYEDRSDILWLGTLNGLFQFDRVTESFISIAPAPPLPVNFIPNYRAIKEDSKGDLWFATDKAIMTYRKTEGITTELVPLYGNKIQVEGGGIIQDIYLEPPQNGEILWIALGDLIRFNTLTGDHISFKHKPDDPYSIIGSTFKNIYEDDQGTLWITSHAGINILDKESYQIEKHSDFFDRFGCDATVFFEDSYDLIWIGTSSKGIMCFDNQMNQLNWYESLYIDEFGFDRTGIIWKIYEDDDRNLWMGDNHSGLYLYDRSKDLFNHCELEGLEAGKDIIWINDIYKDSQGVLWIATQSGLYKREKGVQSLTNFTFIRLSNLHWHRSRKLYL